jgi:hypothetical protein
MRTRFLASAAVLAVTAATVPSGSGSTQSIQQCYHRVILDPDGACTTCSNACLGEGYKCCIIVSG